jgi:Holliday junction DNA helicase RuvA
MIGSLRGKLISKQAPNLLIEVQGIGYEVEAPMSTFYDLPAEGHDIFLYTHLTIREDAHLLFGFAKLEERTLFRHLIKINHVGPKLSLGILSALSPQQFVSSIQLGDSTTLERIPGVGKKTAQRLVIEMKDRLQDWTIQQPGNLYNFSEGGIKQDAISALISLGYKPQIARQLIEKFPTEPESSEELIKYALQKL